MAVLILCEVEPPVGASSFEITEEEDETAVEAGGDVEWKNGMDVAALVGVKRPAELVAVGGEWTMSPEEPTVTGIETDNGTDMDIAEEIAERPDMVVGLDSYIWYCWYCCCCW